MKRKEKEATWMQTMRKVKRSQGETALSEGNLPVPWDGLSPGLVSPCLTDQNPIQGHSCKRAQKYTENPKDF